MLDKLTYQYQWYMSFDRFIYYQLNMVICCMVFFCLVCSLLWRLVWVKTRLYTSINTFQFDETTKIHSILIKFTFFTLLKTIELIIIYFNIRHFQLLLGVVLLVFITFENSSRKCAWLNDFALHWLMKFWFFWCHVSTFRPISLGFFLIKWTHNATISAL